LRKRRDIEILDRGSWCDSRLIIEASGLLKQEEDISKQCKPPLVSTSPNIELYQNDADARTCVRQIPQEA
jgi:hypothetical protein